MPDDVILLVEDDPDDVVLAMRALRRSKMAWEVVIAPDGAEALDYLFGTGAHEGRDPADTPCLVLLDLKLPKIDGHEVLRRIRDHGATRLLPVVVLTSSKEDIAVIESYDFGANGCIRKPVDSDRLTEVVGQLGIRCLRVNESPSRLGGVGID